MCSPLERFALLVCQLPYWDLVTAPANHTPPLINTIHCSIYNPISRPALWKGHINSLRDLPLQQHNPRGGGGRRAIQGVGLTCLSATLGYLSCSECCRTNFWKRGLRWAKRGASNPEALGMKRTWHSSHSWLQIGSWVWCHWDCSISVSDDNWEQKEIWLPGFIIPGCRRGTFQGNGLIKARVHVVRAGCAGVASGSASQPREHAPEGIYYTCHIR